MSVVDQWQEHLNLANQTRVARAALKRRVRAGDVTVADVLVTPPPEALTMSLLELLSAQHRWGRDRSLRLVREAAMSETRRVGEMTERQRFAVAMYLTGELDDPRGWWS